MIYSITPEQKEMLDILWNIPDEEHMRCFLENIPEQKRAMALTLTELIILDQIDEEIDERDVFPLAANMLREINVKL